MVDAKAMQDRRVQIVDMDGVANDVIAEIVGFPPYDSRFDAAAGEPDGKATAMMVAAVVGLQGALSVNGAPKLAGPNDERVLQHAAPFEVENESRLWLVNVARLTWDVDRQAIMVVPAAVI